MSARASLRVRLLSLVYEALLLAAVLIVATGLFTAVLGDSRTGPLRLALRIYLLATTGGYFIWSWTGGRRTLPMRTWRLRLVDAAGNAPRARIAATRFLAAAVAIPLGGLALWWAVFDRDRQFLHDRIAGTRLVRDPPRRTR